MRRGLRTIVEGAVVAWLLAAPAEAARPLVTEDTGTVDAGHGELEISLTGGEQPDSRTLAGAGIMSLGIVEGVEARIESQGVLIDPDRRRIRGGSGDGLFGLKVRLLEETTRQPGALFGLTVEIPSGDEERGLGIGEAGVGGLGVLSRTAWDTIFTANLGYTWVPENRDLERWFVAGSVEHLLDGFALVAEIVSTMPVDDRDSNVLRGGIVWPYSDRVRLDFATGFGLTRGSSRWTITAGATLVLF